MDVGIAPPGIINTIGSAACCAMLLGLLASHYEAEAVSNPGVWHLANPRRKYHATCGYAHAGADALVVLYRELGGQVLAEAREIVIRVPFYTHRAAAKNQPPATPTEARFHLPFAAAMGAMGA